MCKFYSILFFISIGLLPLNHLTAQAFYKQQPLTQVWINAQTSNSEAAYLYLLGDSSLYLAKNPTVYATQITEYQVPDIYTLKLRRKGSVGTGILLGAVAGFLANGVIDLLRRRPTQSACGVCPLLAELDAKRGPNRQRYIGTVLLGGAVGGLIGGIKINISIGGSYDRFEYHRKELGRHQVYP